MTTTKADQHKMGFLYTGSGLDGPFAGDPVNGPHTHDYSNAMECATARHAATHVPRHRRPIWVEPWANVGQVTA